MAEVPNTRLQFGEWKPDIGEIDSGALTVCENVFPGLNCYLPMPGFNPYGTGSVLVGPPLGYIMARDVAGNYQLFVAANDGTKDRIYWYEQTLLAWVDVSRSGGYLPSDQVSGWRFAQFGSYVYAVSGINNVMQKLDMASPASGFFDASGLGPTQRARYIGVVNNFLVLGSLDTMPYAVRWSEVGNADNWRPLVNGSDTQAFPDGSWVTGLAGGEYGLVLQERCIRRMIFSPGAVGVFDFQRIQQNRGCPSPGSIAQAGDRSFWLGEDGFWMEYQGQTVSVGRERVDRTFQSVVAGDGFARILSYGDPIAQRVYWGFPSRSNTNTTNRILDTVYIYDFALDRWSAMDGSEDGLTYLIPVATIKYNLDDPPIADYEPSPPHDPGGVDSIKPSFDDPYWDGGRPRIGGFDDQNRLGTFTGDPMQALITTGLIQLIGPERAVVQRASVLTDTGAALLQVATRNKPDGNDHWRTERATSGPGGYIGMEVEGLFHRFQTRVPSGANWAKLQGLALKYIPAGEY